MNRSIFLAATAAALLAASPALACSIVVPATPPTAAQVEANTLARVAASAAVVEIEIVKADTAGGPGALRVLRSIKGDLRPGAVLPALPMGSAACGPDRLVPGPRGFVFLRDTRLPLMVGPFAEPRVAAVLLRRQQAAMEAARRPVMSFQLEAREVHERVRHDPHFAGFILRHDPEPHALVRFTGDAAARLRRYTSDPRYKAVGADFTLAELEGLKDQMSAKLAGLGLRCWMVDADEVRNKVTVEVVETDKLNRAVAEGRLKLPRQVLVLQGRGCPELRRMPA